MSIEQYYACDEPSRSVDRSLDVWFIMGQMVYDHLRQEVLLQSRAILDLNDTLTIVGMI